MTIWSYGLEINTLEEVEREMGNTNTMSDAMYVAAIEAINADLPWYAKMKDSPETRAMVLKVYQAILAAGRVKGTIT